MKIYIHAGGSTIVVPGRRRTADAFTAAEIADLLERMMAARDELLATRTQDKFEEHKHKRDDSGKFSTTGGGGKAPEAPAAAPTHPGKSGMHKLLSSGKAMSKADIMAATGIKTDKLFTDYIAMLKNPKYAGKAGALTITKNSKGEYVAAPNNAPAPAAEAPAPAPAPAPVAAPVAPPPLAPVQKISSQATALMAQKGFKEAATVQHNGADWKLYTKGDKKLLLGTGAFKGKWVSQSPGNQTKMGDTSAELNKLLDGGVAGKNIGFNVGVAEGLEKHSPTANKPPAAQQSPADKLKELHNMHEGRLASMSDAYKKAAKGQAPVTQEQYHAINHYTGAGYNSMNSTLRKKRGQVTEADNQYIQHIESYLDNASFPETMVTTRGIKGDFAEALASSLDEGSIFVDYGFVSTGVNFKFNGGASMKITVPKGAKAAAISHIGGNLSESEVLLQRGSRFHVDKVEGNTFHVTLLPPKPKGKK